MDSTVRTILRKNAVKPADAERLSAENLGQRVRQLRTDKDLTQKELARRGGVSHSALSKIENSQLSPTFETILRIAEGLSIDVSELLSSPNTTQHRTRRTITRKGEGENHESDSYVYQTLCNDITNKRMIPLVARIKARSLEQFGTLMRHPGEEVLYILEGEIELHTEHYASVRLGPGDCVYFDSSMGHACVSTGKDEALVFWVSTPT
jgi:transcriptional regulator with XRE-family HTH domain